eukprot:m.168449 g.168449  ORF g.168449 m.168449 type:complete len:559 (-) comp17788_c2_seq1:1603-3279(-)
MVVGRRDLGRVLVYEGANQGLVVDVPSELAEQMVADCSVAGGRARTDAADATTSTTATDDDAAATASKRSLVLLDLGCNALGSVPPCLLQPVQCAHITVLDLHGNGLTAFAGAVCHALPQLATLFLDSNALTALPDDDDLLLLKRLQKLHVGQNKLTALSGGVLTLPRLEVLSASGNQLSTLPPAPPPPTSSSPPPAPSPLRQAYLHDNCLTSVAGTGLATVTPTLERVMLAGNPLQDVPGDGNWAAWDDEQGAHAWIAHLTGAGHRRQQQGKEGGQGGQDTHQPAAPSEPEPGAETNAESGSATTTNASPLSKTLADLGLSEYTVTLEGLGAQSVEDLHLLEPHELEQAVPVLLHRRKILLAAATTPGASPDPYHAQHGVNPFVSTLAGSANTSTSSTAGTTSSTPPPPATSGAGAKYDVFVSLRFAEAKQEALAIKAALEARGATAFVCDVAPGEDIKRVVIHALDGCRLPVVLGTRTYGQETASTFSTHEEMEHIVSEHKKHRKPYFLVKMCEEFEVAAARFNFRDAISYFRWNSQETPTPPAQLLDQIMAKLQG